MGRPINSATRLRATQLLFFTISALYTSTWQQTEPAATAKELLKGFLATPSPSISTFQPVLTDSTGKFSLGFLRVNTTKLALAVVHVASFEPLWFAMTPLARWSKSTQLTFDGSLVLSDRRTEVFWSTNTNGDRVLIHNTSNLEIQKVGNGNPPAAVWQSFQFPTNTLVQSQNFTSKMSLISSNGLYAMRLGDKFIGLYAKFRVDSDQIYLKHKALEVKANIIEGKGPIYARVNSDGFLGMYQTSNTVPVDVEAFNSFNRPINGFLFVRLETNGNLKGYYWDGSNWVLVYQAIKDECELPSPCGSYGLCQSGKGCSCIDNRTEYTSGVGCSSAEYGDVCGEEETKNNFLVLRRKGVELPYKELVGFDAMSSLDECEKSCELNCSCWGAVYNNASGFCYKMDYAIQTLVGVGDETKVGYFKVRIGRKEDKVDVGFGVEAALVGVGLFLLVAVAGFGGYRFLRRRNRARRFMEEDGGVSPGPYKDLGSASFRSIELSRH